MKSTLPFFVLTIFPLLFSCQPNKAKKEYQTKVKEAADLIQQDEILLLCQPVKNPSMPDMPENEVFLQLVESKAKVADVMDCQIITPKNYAQYDIPKNAISAVGGWWAGAGDYLYIAEEEGNYVIKKAHMEEMQTDTTYIYKEVVKYNKKGELMTND